MSFLEWERTSYIRTDNFFGFTVPQLETNFNCTWIIARVSPIPDLDDEILDFLSWYWDEIFDLDLKLEFIKTFGDGGMRWVYFLHGIDVNFGEGVEERE